MGPLGSRSPGCLTFSPVRRRVHAPARRGLYAAGVDQRSPSPLRRCCTPEPLPAVPHFPHSHGVTPCHPPAPGWACCDGLILPVALSGPPVTAPLPTASHASRARSLLPATTQPQPAAPGSVTPWPLCVGLVFPDLCLFLWDGVSHELVAPTRLAANG